MHRVCLFYLFYFIVIAYLNHHFFGFKETQTQTKSSTGTGTLVSVFQTADSSHETTTALDTRNFSSSPLSGRPPSASDLSRHVSVPIRGVIPLALPVLPVKQEIARPLSAVQTSLDNWPQTRDATGSLLLAHRGGTAMERMGIAQTGPTEAEAITQQEFACQERERKGFLWRERTTTAVTLRQPGNDTTMAIARLGFA